MCRVMLASDRDKSSIEEVHSPMQATVLYRVELARVLVELTAAVVYAKNSKRPTDGVVRSRSRKGHGATRAVSRV